MIQKRLVFWKSPNQTDPLPIPILSIWVFRTGVNLICCFAFFVFAKRKPWSFSLQGIFFRHFQTLYKLINLKRNSFWFFTQATGGFAKTNCLSCMFILHRSVLLCFFLWLYSKEEKCMDYGTFVNKIRRIALLCEKIRSTWSYFSSSAGLFSSSFFSPSTSGCSPCCVASSLSWLS